VETTDVERRSLRHGALSTAYPAQSMTGPRFNPGWPLSEQIPGPLSARQGGMAQTRGLGVERAKHIGRRSHDLYCRCMRPPL